MLSASRLSVVVLILVATVLFVVGIVWERNPGEHHSESVAQASETAAEKAGESSGSSASSTEGGAATETPAEHAAEAGGETSGESGEKVLGISYESTPLVIAAVLVSLGLTAIVWFGRVPWFLLVVTLAMLAFAVFDVAEVFPSDRSIRGRDRRPGGPRRRPAPGCWARERPASARSAHLLGSVRSSDR